MKEIPWENPHEGHFQRGKSCPVGRTFFEKGKKRKFDIYREVKGKLSKWKYIHRKEGVKIGKTYDMVQEWSKFGLRPL